MTEYRLIGSAIVDGEREGVWFHVRDSGEPSWAVFEALLSTKCAEKGYMDPVLIDWYVA